jgi:hypothetical protein
LIIKIIFIVLIILGCHNLNAQIQLSAYSDVGHSNISEGIYLKTSADISYKYHSFVLQSGFHNDIISNNTTLFSGFKLNVSHFFKFKQKNYNAKLFFISTTLSDFVHETNYGVLLSTEKEHFNFKIGAGFKNIGFTKNAIAETGINANGIVQEIFNPLYNFSYTLNKAALPWNVGIGITNIDHFIVNQATNPMTTVFGHYKISDSVRLTAEVWYKTAGAFNLHVNYFGLFFRPGVIWELK